MVDVWKELGAAVGRALKPLAEMSAAIWTSLVDGIQDMVTKLLASAPSLKDQTRPSMDTFYTEIIDEATGALGEGSPPKEIKEAVDKMVLSLMTMIEKESKTEGKSLPTDAELAVTQAKLVAGIIGMYATTHAVSIALDATHPLNDWGFKAAIMDMLYQFKMSDVISPMLTAPIWSSVVVPLRYRANAAYPYQVPGTGILPIMRAKDIITDEEYKTNMKYSAYDNTWAAHMLENTARFPSFSELRTMVHRTPMTWTEAKSALEKSLIQADYVDNYEALLPTIPGIGDLITMMVREVITKEVFIENAGLMGLSAEWADNYYENHWILLPLGEVKKARHRGDIDDGELDKFLVLHDYRPEARPGITTSDRDLAAGLIYDLPGRIESRWLYRWGEIEVSELQLLLEKQGLDPNWSKRVAAAVAKNQFLVDINRQVANSKASFVKGYSFETDLRSDLVALGFRSEIVEYHVVDALAARERSILDEELRTLRAQYARGALTLDEVIAAVTTIIIDVPVRDAWIAALPSAKQVIIMEETFGTEINRMVANAKSDYVRGYVKKEPFVSRLQLLDLPTEVIKYHIMDGDEDRARKHNDKELAIVEEGYIDDLIAWEDVEAMARPILKDDDAYSLFLDEVWLNKHKAKRVAAGE